MFTGTFWEAASCSGLPAKNASMLDGFPLAGSGGLFDGIENCLVAVAVLEVGSELLPLAYGNEQVFHHIYEGVLVTDDVGDGPVGFHIGMYGVGCLDSMESLQPCGIVGQIDLDFVH